MPLVATFKTPVILSANCFINGSSLVPLNTLNTPSIVLIFAKALSAIVNPSVTIVKNAIAPANACATAINGGKIFDAPSKANCHCSNEAIHDWDLDLNLFTKLLNWFWNFSWPKKSFKRWLYLFPAIWLPSSSISPPIVFKILSIISLNFCAHFCALVNLSGSYILLIFLTTSSCPRVASVPLGPTIGGSCGP